MNSISKIPQVKSNIYFTGYGKITREHYQITDKVIEDVFSKATTEYKDIASALAESINREVSELEALYKKPLSIINEFFNTLKKDSKTCTKNSLKKLFAESHLADEDGNMTKLPYKKIVIEAGDDVIPDEIVANEITDNGSRGLTMIKGNIIDLTNTQSKDLEVFANIYAGIRNSEIKSLESGSALVNNSIIKESIKNKTLFVGRNVSSNNLESSTVELNGEQNFVSRIEAIWDVTSENALTAFFVKSTTGEVNIKGKNNQVKYVKAKGDIRMMNNVGRVAESTEGKITGENNKVNKIIAKEMINLENTGAEIVESTDKEVILLGSKNNIEKYIKAKELVKAQNLVVGDVFCEGFRNFNDAILVKGKLQTKQPQKQVLSSEIKEITTMPESLTDIKNSMIIN